MEKADYDLLLQLADHNPHLRQLYDEHIELDKEVEKASRYAAYSASAALRHKELKKAKLRGMDTILSILCEHRDQSAAA